MTAPFPAESSTAQAVVSPKIEFGRGCDGLVVARVADTAFAMLPAREAGIISRPAGA